MPPDNPSPGAVRAAERVRIRYRLAKGKVARMESLPFSALESRLDELCRRGIAASATFADGSWAGEVWKNERRWTWTCETPDHAYARREAGR